MRAFPTNIHHVKQKQIGACVFPEEKEEEGSGFGYESLHVQTFVFFCFCRTSSACNTGNSAFLAATFSFKYSFLL